MNFLNFFRKKNKEQNTLSDKEFEVLSKILSELPISYRNSYNFFNKKYVIGKEDDLLRGKGNFTILFNTKNSVEFPSEETGVNIIKGINIYNTKLKTNCNLVLNIFEGILIGYYSSCELEFCDPSKLDLSGLIIQKFGNECKEEILEISNFKETEISKKLLNLNDAFTIEINGQVYYTIKNMGDGNFFSINKMNEVFVLIHDPYCIKKTDMSFKVFLDRLNDNNQYAEEIFQKLS